MKKHIYRAHEGGDKDKSDKKLKKSIEKKVKNHTCHLCGKAFSSAQYLNNHITCVHEGVKNFQCKSCNKTFSQLGNLQRHVASVHEGAKLEKVICTICGKLLSQKFLKQHMVSVHSMNNEAQLKCPICQKAFAENHRLKQHMNVHTGVKPYKCKYCGQCFADSGNKRNHEKTVHEGIKRSQEIKVNSVETPFI